MKAAVLAAVFLGLATSASFGARIGLFSAADYSSCNLSLPTGSGTFYIVAVDADSTVCCAPGLAGAAFSIRGLPAGWTTTVTPAPQAIAAVGDPFAAGAHIAFSS